MGHFADIKSQEFYRKQNIPANPNKPEIHFYPDITDEALRKDEFDIDFTLSYADCLKKINEGLDDIHTPQMAFANPKTAEVYECYMHYLDLANATQRIALIEFSLRGEIVVKQWI